MIEPQPAPRVWPALLASVIGISILVTLGFWQLERLQWKESLLALLAANAAAEPVDLREAEAIQAQGGDIEFLKVKFSGIYLHDDWKKMISTFGGSQGWIIITPAVSVTGRPVLVDRGRVPVAMLESFDKPEGLQEIIGIARSYTRGKGYFDPENDPAANLWYWWDVPAMFAASAVPEGLKPMPFVVQVLPGTTAAEFPAPQEPRTNLTNNHLGYAITWFGLALTLAGVATAYLIEIRKRKPA